MPAHFSSTPPADPVFVWDESLATGLPDVDAQHQTLFDLTERLRTLHNSQPATADLLQLLRELDAYAAHHFQTEEALMEERSVSSVHQNLHRQAHQAFISHLKRTTHLATACPTSAAELLLAFLTQWLLHHVAIMDMLLAEEIHATQHDHALSQPRLLSTHFKQTFIENLNKVYSDLADRTFQIMELNLLLQSEIRKRNDIEQELTESKTRFRMMADHAHSWEYWQGPDHQIIYMSPSCLRITGYTQEAFSADPDLLKRIVHPDDRHLLARYTENASMQEDGEDELGIRIIHRDGSIRWIIHSSKHLYSPSADFLGLRVSNRDITNRQLHNDSMLLVANVFESINEAALITDHNNRIIVVNTAFSDITGYQPEEVIGNCPGMLAEKPVSPDQVSDLMRKATNRGHWRGELNYRRKSGVVFTAAVSIDSMRDRHDNISNYIIVFSDVSERKESEQRIHYLAHHDLLTGLPNWKLFSERIQQALESSQRRHRPFCLMYVDIDRFKQTKDKIGHETSDLLLKYFAARMQTLVPETATVARIGSDEFVVLFPNLDTAPLAMEKAQSLLPALSAPLAVGSEMLRVSASIGVAMYPKHGKTVPQLMKSADLAVFQAKRAGGGAMRFFDGEAPSDA